MKKLLKQYGQIVDLLRDEVRKQILKAFKKSDGLMSFTTDVMPQFIDDNVHTILRRVKREGNDLTFIYERKFFDTIDDFEATLEEYDAAALYEILLALSEKNYRIE